MTRAHLRPGLWLALVLVPVLVPALARAQKSGLLRAEPLTRCGYSRSWCMRMVP